MASRRAKIVCTLGPAVDSPSAIQGLVGAGMDVARLNFSHGTHAEHRARAERVREASRALGKPVAILQDLSGPKIRTAKSGPLAVRTGDELTLVGRGPADARVLVVEYDTLAEDVKVGDRVLLSDGQIQLSVTAVEGERVRTRVEHGGGLRPHMGVNLPSHRLKLQALTDKDRRDLEYGLSMGVDYIALSFVRSAADIEELRALCGPQRTPIVAKIETSAAVEHLGEVVTAADAVMVARGDLGVELLPERVPVIQRQILAACREQRKPAIVATEMLESMVRSPLPTRAEVSDVAGAVFGGADAVMLSAETATGQNPILACEMMARIIRTAEASSFFVSNGSPVGSSSPEAIAHSACAVAERVGARSIVALTTSGATARLVSKSRPAMPILACSPEERTLQRLALLWGVEPVNLDVAFDLESLVSEMRAQLARRGLLAAGDRFVLVYGAPLGERGPTNAIRVEEA